VLGGEIRVWSAPGGGSAFTLLVPDYSEPAQPLGPAPATGVGRAGPGPPTGDEPAAPDDDRAPPAGGHRVALMPAASRRVPEQPQIADSALSGKRVLIADDDVRNVFALASALEARGMSVRFAENGREAIESLHADPAVDIVLMDVMMPELNGHEATRALRADERFGELPIIALTAQAMNGDREKSIAAGASDYITKPIDVEQLISLMRVWLCG